MIPMLIFLKLYAWCAFAFGMKCLWNMYSNGYETYAAQLESSMGISRNSFGMHVVFFIVSLVGGFIYLPVFILLIIQNKG